jgi:Leucine-rich repeat (LRR) protein
VKFLERRWFDGWDPVSTWVSLLLNNFDLSGNKLTSSLPSEIRNLTSLTMLALYANELTGTILSELLELSALTDLEMYGN